MIVEVTRGNTVESRHLVDIVVCDAAGVVVQSWGDGQRPVFPRSAIKALQALALVESGAADHYQLTDEQLALACSSHNGEEIHTKGAAQILAKAGLDETCLECGAQHPKHMCDVERLAKNGQPVSAIHNNCSGKHAGFLALATHQNLPVNEYVKLGHPLQTIIANTLSEVTGANHSKDNHGIDGCSIPTYEIPMDNLATGFAKLSIGEDKDKSRSDAFLRLRDACMKHPQYVAGSDRFDTSLMKSLNGRAFTKTGAEGVFTIAIPELGFGAALKCQDGTTRAAESACAKLIESLLQTTDSGLSQTESKALKRLANPILRNWNDIEIGQVRIGA